MVDRSSFRLISKKLNTDTMRRIDHIDVSLVANDAGKTAGSDDTTTPAVYFTDIMFQSGTVATSWVGHVSEIRWSFDNA